jgi:hypothetical protein
MLKVIKVLYLQGKKPMEDVIDAVTSHEFNPALDFYVVKCATGEIYSYNKQFLVSISIEDMEQ